MNTAQIKGIRTVAASMNTKAEVTVGETGFGQWGVYVAGKLAGVCVTREGALELARVIQ